MEQFDDVLTLAPRERGNRCVTNGASQQELNQGWKGDKDIKRKKKHF